MRLHADIVRFFENQNGAVVSTVDARGGIHCSIKGIVSVGKQGKIFLVDLYFHRTFQNLKKDPTISITSVDEHAFKGYTLQGKAKIVPRNKIKKEIFAEWEKRVIDRITKRVRQSVQRGSKSRKHFEAHLPIQPKYLIEVKINNVIDLAPPQRTAIK